MPRSTPIPLKEFRKTVSTRAKRLAIAETLFSTFSQIDLVECGYKETGKGIRFDLSMGPYKLTVDIDGASSVGAFVVHWYMEPDELRQYPPYFDTDIGGTLNEYHFRKATSVATNVEELTRSIDGGLCRLVHARCVEAEAMAVASA